MASRVCLEWRRALPGSWLHGRDESSPSRRRRPIRVARARRVTAGFNSISAASPVRNGTLTRARSFNKNAISSSSCGLCPTRTTDEKDARSRTASRASFTSRPVDSRGSNSIPAPTANLSKPAVSTARRIGLDTMRSGAGSDLSRSPSHLACSTPRSTSARSSSLPGHAAGSAFPCLTMHNRMPDPRHSPAPQRSAMPPVHLTPSSPPSPRETFP